MIADFIFDGVKEMVEYNLSWDAVKEELYDAEENFNNCDPTSKQRCFELAEIEAEMEASLILLCEQEGRCWNCGKEYTTSNVCVVCGEMEK